MKRFLFQTSLFLLLILVGLYGVLMQADGFTDPYYIRFTTSRQSSLIVGNSRAAQGVQPAILNRCLGRSDFFNYAFTLGHSPYGPVYLESINRKLDKGTTDGRFIVTVDPWSICTKGKNPNDTTQFAEKNRLLGKLKYVNLNPNFFYLTENFERPLVSLLRHNPNNITFLHEDGWLEVSPPKMDSAAVAERTSEKILDYEKSNLPFFKYSEARVNSLKQIIQALSAHGKVYLVRLPVYADMLVLEDRLMPDFERRMSQLALKNQIPYLSFVQTGDSCVFTDGNHLYKESGAKVTKRIASWMLENDK